MHALDGRQLAAQIQEKLAQDQKARSYTPTLAVMIVGDDPASHLYVRMKQRAGEAVGFAIRLHAFPAETPTASLIAQIRSWNQDSGIQGILVQVPLPPGHEESAVVRELAPEKDVDGFHPANVAALEAGNPSLVSPVHEGILKLINAAPVRVNGAQTSIIGNSEVFTKPLQHLLTTSGAIVHIMSPDDLDQEWLAASHIVVIAIGRAHFLKPKDVRHDAVIIDVGTNRDKNNKVSGDVETAAFAPTDCWVTPVPGGVGPMTIALLLQNLALCADAQQHNKG